MEADEKAEFLAFVEKSTKDSARQSAEEPAGADDGSGQQGTDETPDGQPEEDGQQPAEAGERPGRALPASSGP